MPTVTLTRDSVSPWSCPAGATNLVVTCYGAGGAGGSSYAGRSQGAGGGGGGGACSRKTYAVPGSVYDFAVGLGGVGGAADKTGGDTWFGPVGNRCLAKGGGGGGTGTSTAGGAGGAGGLASSGSGDTRYGGGNGYAGQVFPGTNGGGGGEGGSPTADGISASSRLGATGTAGGNGANGGIDHEPGASATESGGGGGGGADTYQNGLPMVGGSGADGSIVLTYDMPEGDHAVTPGPGHVSMHGYLVEIAAASLTLIGLGTPQQLAVASYAPTVAVTMVITGDGNAKKLSVTGYAPTVTIESTAEAQTRTPETGHIVVSNYLPYVSSAESRLRIMYVSFDVPDASPSITPTTGHLIVSGHLPDLGKSGEIIPDAGRMIAVGYIPTVSQSLVIPTSGHLIFTGHAVDILNSELQIAIRVAGVDRSTWAMQGSLTIKRALNTRPTLSLVFRDKEPLAAYRPALRDEILVTANGEDIFGGIIYKPSQRGQWTSILFQDVDAVGFSIYAEKRYVTRTWGGTAAVNGYHPAGSTQISVLALEMLLTLKAGYTVTIAGQPITYTLAADVTADDLGCAVLTLTTGLSVVANNDDEIAIGTTPRQILADLVNDYLAIYGITLDPSIPTGSVLDQVKAEDSVVADVIDAVCERARWVWEITPGKVLKAFAPGSITAPWSITPSTRNINGEPTVEPSLEDYADLVTLRCGAKGKIRVDSGPTWTGADGVHDGSLRYFYFPMPSDNDMSGVRPNQVTVEGYPQISGVVSDGPSQLPNPAWWFDVGPHFITVASGITMGVCRYVYNAGLTGIEIPDATRITANSYTVAFPFVLKADAGNPYPWEVILDDEKVEDRSAGIAVVQAQLEARSASRNELGYPTIRSGLTPGMMQDVNIPERAVNEAFLITDVEFRHEVQKGGRADDALWRYQIKATEGDTYLKTWRDFYKALSGGTTVSPSTGSIVSTTTPSTGGGGVTRFTVPLGGSTRDAIPGIAVPTMQEIQHATHFELGRDDHQGLTATIRIYVRSRTPGVTASVQLWDHTGAYLGTPSTPISSTSWTLVTLSVPMPSSTRHCHLRAVAGAANEDIWVAPGILEIAAA